MSGRPAVFLDRDGTLVRDPGYLADPDAVVLLPGAAAAVQRLNRAGWAAVVITNQSGIARGLVTPVQYAAVAERLDALLQAAGARLDGTYHCPHLPEISGPCDCRKPGTRLYREAAADLGLDLARSWLVGDRVRDVAAVAALGARGGVLVGQGDDAGYDGPRAAGVEAAVDMILEAAGRPAAPDGYLPAP